MHDHYPQDQAQLSHVMQCLVDARDGRDLDAEVFQRLIVTTRNVAVARPANLVKFAEKATTAVQTEQRRCWVCFANQLKELVFQAARIEGEPISNCVTKNLAMELTDIEDGEKESQGAEAESAISKLIQLDHSEKRHMMVQLLDAFWKLHAAKPGNVSLAPVCLPGENKKSSLTA